MITIGRARRLGAVGGKRLTVRDKWIFGRLAGKYHAEAQRIFSDGWNARTEDTDTFLTARFENITQRRRGQIGRAHV